jgi:hypothetical protein
VLWLCACSSTPRSVTLPSAVEGGWKLQSSTPVAASEAPGRIPSLKPLLIFHGSYDGPTAIEVDVYLFRNSTAAFEALQSWRPDGQRVIRQHNDLFITARSPQPDRSALDTFLNNLEKTL